MAIDVRIPKEITEYQEKILFGMSIRQLICAFVAVVVGGGTYMLLQEPIGPDNASTVLMFEVLPIFAFGFIKPKGFKTEQYLKILIKHRFTPQKRIYKNELVIDRLEELENGIIPQKAEIKPEKRSEVEYLFCARDKNECKRTRKATRKAITAAKKEWRRLKYEAKKAERRQGAQNNPAHHAVPEAV